MSKPLRRRTAATAAAALLLAGCTSNGGDRSPGGRVEHEDGEKGPLSIGGQITGGATFDALKVPVWVGTYGSFKLCSRDGAKTVLEGVRLSAGAKPRSVTPWLRTVTAAEAALTEANDPYTDKVRRSDQP